MPVYNVELHHGRKMLLPVKIRGCILFCFTYSFGRTDREQIRSKINNNDCRTFLHTKLLYLLLLELVNALLYCSQLRVLDGVMFAVKLKKFNATKRCLLDLVYMLTRYEASQCLVL